MSRQPHLNQVLHSCRTAEGGRPSRNAPSNNAADPDNDIIAAGHAGEDNRTSTNSDVTPDDDRSAELLPGLARNGQLLFALEEYRPLFRGIPIQECT